MYRCQECGTPAPAGTLFGMELGCYECGGALEQVGTVARREPLRAEESTAGQRITTRVA